MSDKSRIPLLELDSQRFMQGLLRISIGCKSHTALARLTYLRDGNILWKQQVCVCVCNIYVCMYLCIYLWVMAWYAVPVAVCSIKFMRSINMSMIQSVIGVDLQSTVIVSSSSKGLHKLSLSNPKTYKINKVVFIYLFVLVVCSCSVRTKFQDPN